MSDKLADGIAVLVDDGVFLESPRWHDGAFWFSDIGGGYVGRAAPDGRREKIVPGLQAPSGLGWTRDGDLLIASLHTSTIYCVGADGVPVAVAGPEQHGTLATNDMVTVGDRSYVTCAGRTFEMGDDETALSQALGTIVLYDHVSRAARVVADGLKMPNGVAITPDGKTLIVAELYAARILNFDVHPDGSLSEARALVQLDHIVDGLCLDAEGGLWLGTGGPTFQRIDAEGRPTDTVELPGWSCVAPMLGGPDGRTLIMAANAMEKPDDIFTGKAKGRLLTAQVAVPAASR